MCEKTLFKGTLVSDDASVYQCFSEAQKCWAHLLRKAIKRTLTSPDEPRYRELADGLLDIDRDAKRISEGGRNTEETRKSKVGAMDDRILELCGGRWADDNPSGAKRRSIISIVLRSIGKQLESFTLENVIAEVKQWMIRGKSSFREKAEKVGHTPPTGILNTLVINADSPTELLGALSG